MRLVLGTMLHNLFTIPGDADTGRRGRTLILIALVLIMASLLGVAFIIFQPGPLHAILLTSTLLSTIVFAGMIGLAHRGLVDVAGWIMILSMAITLIPPIYLDSNGQLALIYIAIPVVVSGMILRPWQIWVVTLVGVGMVLVKAYSVAPINLDINSIILLIILGAVSQLGAYNVRTSFSAAEAARRSAAEAAGRFEQLNIELEDKVDARTSELHAAFRTAEAQVSERQALLDEIASQQVVIREMSVPVLPVSAHILVMPLVGVLDSSRLAEIQSQALSAIEQSGAHTLLIDLTGVPIVDTQVAQGLLRTVQAARLLGTNPVLIGIRPEVAQSIVSLGIDLSEVQTKASLASALRIGGG